MWLTRGARALALCVVAVLFAGCAGGQDSTARSRSVETQVVPPLQWPARQTGGSDLDAARQAVLTAAHKLIGPANAVQVFFDGMTPAGRVIAALVGRPGTTRFVWLRQPPHESKFRVDGAVDGRSILAEPLLGVRYALGSSSYVLAITQPTCKEILLSGAGIPARQVKGFDGVFELATTAPYSDAQAMVPGHPQHSVRLLTVAGA